MTRYGRGAIQDRVSSSLLHLLQVVEPLAIERPHRVLLLGAEHGNQALETADQACELLGRQTARKHLIELIAETGQQRTGRIQLRCDVGGNLRKERLLLLGRSVFGHRRSESRFEIAKQAL